MVCHLSRSCRSYHGVHAWWGGWVGGRSFPPRAELVPKHAWEKGVRECRGPTHHPHRGREVRASERCATVPVSRSGGQPETRERGRRYWLDAINLPKDYSIYQTNNLPGYLTIFPSI
jgi:hypothetical protein